MMPVRGMLLSRGAVYRNPFTDYNRALKRYPLTTKCLTCALGMSIGDLIAQVMAKRAKSKRFRIDMARLSRAAVFGGMVNGPIGHYWFNALDCTILPRSPAHPVAVVTKCALDQLIMAPIGTVLFLASMKLMQGKPQECLQEVKTKLIPTMKDCYKLWPAAHIVNFAFVPTELRILYINIISIVWSVILTGSAQTPAEPKLCITEPV